MRFWLALAVIAALGAVRLLWFVAHQTDGTWSGIWRALKGR